MHFRRERLQSFLRHLQPFVSQPVSCDSQCVPQRDGVEAELIYNGVARKSFVRNGRGQGHTLERDGFVLSSLPFRRAEGVNLYDLNLCQKTMYPIASDVLRSAFPSSTKVLVFDHILRNQVRYAEETNGGKTPPTTPMIAEGPVKYVHGDYTARSGFTRARQLLEPFEFPDRIEMALCERFAFVNVWVPMKPVERDPLGLIEWGSVVPRDAVTVTFTYTHRKGEIYRVLHSDAHRWVYFPDMVPGECIIFKQFDSDEVGPARFAFHSAFEDPTSCATAPPRESMELRCIVFFGSLPDRFADDWPDLPDQELKPQHVDIGPVTDEW